MEGAWDQAVGILPLIFKMNIQDIVIKAASIDGWMDDGELEWLAKKAAACETIIEIGSWKGRSTKALALATSGVVLAVDHWMGSPSRRKSTHLEAAEMGPDRFFSIFKSNLSLEIKTGKVIPIRAESGEAVKIVELLLKGRGAADMVFIDGDHVLNAISKDILNYGPMIKPGGILSGHDYSSGFPDVIKAVNFFLSDVKVDCGSIWYSIKP